MAWCMVRHSYPIPCWKRRHHEYYIWLDQSIRTTALRLTMCLYCCWSSGAESSVVLIHFVEYSRIASMKVWFSSTLIVGLKNVSGPSAVPLLRPVAVVFCLFEWWCERCERKPECSLNCCLTSTSLNACAVKIKILAETSKVTTHPLPTTNKFFVGSTSLKAACRYQNQHVVSSTSLKAACCY